ncbi:MULTISPECIES: WapI family immunity protein [unclassified Paenibacillus]|uniref:WapI family immunity protein n=1 Tax=unclassified Paenibacillus TaxID=185978 RepID=UPI002F3F4603
MKTIQIIKCDEGLITLTLYSEIRNSEEKLYYETIDTAGIEIKSGNYSVSGVLWISIEDIRLFYIGLIEAHKRCKGVAKLINYEGTLELIIEYKTRGYIEVKGTFRERHDKDNELTFNIESDQTYLNELVNELIKIFD